MRKTITMLVLVALLALGGCSVKRTPKGMVDYDVHGLAFRLPDTWTEISSPDPDMEGMKQLEHRSDDQKRWGKDGWVAYGLNNIYGDLAEVDADEAEAALEEWADSSSDEAEIQYIYVGQLKAVLYHIDGDQESVAVLTIARPEYPVSFFFQMDGDQQEYLEETIADLIKSIETLNKDLSYPD